MKTNKGFTIVEILVAIAILSILAVSAGAGIISMLQNQRQKLAYVAEQNVHDASLSFYNKDKSSYLKSCKDSDGANITISQKDVEDVNNFLKEKFKDVVSEDLYQFYKNYTINANSDPTTKYELDPFINVSNRSCYKLVTVGELIEHGLMSDDSGMCDKSSVIVIYKKGDAKNTAGIMESVQQSGICKSNRESESGPVVTINPPSDLNLSDSKRVKVTVTTESSKLKNSFTMQYGWSKSKIKKPTSYNTLEFSSNSEKSGSAEISVEAVDGTRYLWIKGGTELDNKNNKTSDMISGPYDFLPTVHVTYDVNTGDLDSCPSKKIVVLNKSYGINQNNAQESLCTPTKLGYDFKGWYKDGTTKIEDTTIVNQRTDHTLVASWEKHIYNITYNLDGGLLASGQSNPSTYDVETESFTLNNPTKNKFGFIGWTGPGVPNPTKNVTISKGSTGDRTYTANFVLIPTCSLSATPIANENGWNNTDVTINLLTTANPTTYGIAETENSTNNKKSYKLTSETTVDGKTIYGYVKNAGGEGSCSTTIKIDKTPPPAPYIDANLVIRDNLYINKYGSCHPMYPGCWFDSKTYYQANKIQANVTYCSSEEDHNVNCVVEKLSAIGGFETSYTPDPLSGYWKYITKSVTDRCDCRQDDYDKKCPGLTTHHYVMYDRAGNTSSIKIYQVNAMCLGYIAAGEEKELFSQYRNHMINSNNFVVNSDRTITVKSCPSKCKNTY